MYLFAAASGSRAADTALLYDSKGNQTAVQTSAPTAPAILLSPVSQLSRVGGSASFSVVATGIPAPAYQWFRDGDDIEGATSATLFLPILAAGDFADYTVTVTNSEDFVTSSAAALILDSDGDQLPDSWELEKFGNLAQVTHGDPDLDDVTNVEELADGTEPDATASRFFRLTLGPGVTADPAMDRYPSGTPVVLRPAPPPGLNFLEWSGDLAGVEAAVLLVMDDSRSVSARFAETVLDRRWKAQVTERSGAVRALLGLSGGGCLAGGEFSALNGSPARNVAKLLADLSPDPDFAVLPGPVNESFAFSFDKEVRALAAQTDGRLLVAGDFHRVNGVPRRGLARMYPDGSLDRGFNAGNLVNGAVNAVAVLADGRVAIAGEFTEVGGVSRNRVALLGGDGSLDPVFDPGTGFDATVRSVALDTGNRLVCAGEFAQFAGSTVGRVARLGADGTLDAGFNTGGAGADDEVQSVRKLGDGRFALGGKFSHYNGQATPGVVLLDANGARDPSFTGSVLADSVDAILPLAAGRFLIGGNFAAQNGAVFRHDLAVLEADGSVDLAFNAGTGANFSNRVFALADLGGGKVAAAGDFSDFSSSGRNCLLVADLATGALETTPAVHAGLHGSNSDVNDLLALPDGRLLAAGAFTEANGVSRGRLARFLSSGELDPSFDASAAIGSAFQVHSLKRRPDGSLLVGTQTLLRLLENGAADPSWIAPGDSDGFVYDFVEDESGRIWVGGYFGTFGGETRSGLVRLLPNGQVDGSFANALPQYSYVNGLALQADGRIVVAGQIYDPGGTVGLARINEDGTRDATFVPPAGSNEVPGVEILPDGRLLALYPSLIVDSVFRRGPFRLFPNGTLDTGFVSGLTGNNLRIRRLLPLPDGRLLVCGDDFSVGTAADPSRNPRQGIAVLNEDGSLASFDPGSRPLFNAQNSFASVRAVAVDSAGRIHGGGRINEFQWRSRAGLVRFSTAPELEVKLTGIAPVNALVGQSVDLTATAAAHEGSLIGVFFEGSRDGGPFVPVAAGVPQGGGTWAGDWIPDLDGHWLVRAVATDFRARRLASVAMSAEAELPPIDYSQWAAGHFTAGELLDPQVSGPGADSDGDTHRNFDEYFSGTLPKNPGSIPAFVSRFFEVGQQRFPGFVSRGRTNADDATVHLEVSGDLVSWDDNPALTVIVSRVPDGLGFELVSVRAAAAGAKVFLRRRLVQAP